MTTNQDARAAFEARYKSDANDPANAAELALFVAGFEAAVAESAPVAAHEKQSTLHNSACGAQALHKAESAEQQAVADGWRLVPVEPTEEMVVHGFESRPSTTFSTEEEWTTFEAMTGCQQAAHCARLCWAAMLYAAPQAAGLTQAARDVLAERQRRQGEQRWLTRFRR